MVAGRGVLGEKNYVAAGLGEKEREQGESGFRRPPRRLPIAISFHSFSFFFPLFRLPIAPISYLAFSFIS